jgi:NAD(P)-dependent dehydrogenase (short-subunit alcohol dehydrogenase family)
MGQSSLPDLVVVTGAGRGIGRAVALDVAARGATVLCISRTATCVDTARAIRDTGGRAESLQLDLADYSDVRCAVGEWMTGRSERHIGLVLAAGALGPSGPLAQTRLEDWDLALRTNVLGNLAVVQACLAAMQANRWGRILFFSGGGAAYAYPLFPAYSIAKTALVRAVENLHEDLKQSGEFAVAILAPGAVETQMLAAVRASGAEVRTTVPIQEPVAFVHSFLASSNCGLSGRFVHVRDRWPEILCGDASPAREDLWKLRRIE